MITNYFATFVSLFSVLSASSTAYGYKVPFERRAPRGASVRSPFKSSRYSFAATNGTGDDVGNVKDIRYTTNVTINGIDVHVVLDTGSTDLWVSPPGGVGTVNDTGIPLELLYGDGSYGVKGTIAVAPFKFGSYEVPQQAFMDVTSDTIALMEDLGLYGIFGLSFDLGSASPINLKIKSIYGDDATWGRSVLKNIFEQNPTEPNFIGIDLSRTDDLEDTQGGSFGIGELDPKWAAVANSPKLAQSPDGGSRWTTLIDGINIDGISVSVTSSMGGVPAGNARALLDTGDPTGVWPVALWDAVYSRIPGAVKYDTGSLYILPCNSTTNVEVVFGGQKFPIHPLDLSSISDPIDLGDRTVVACISSFKGIDGWASDFDLSLGDSFLRNVYTVFDFGDPASDGTTGKPYIQLLSEINVTTAAAQVATIRGQTMASMPPEIDPAALLRLLTGNAPDPTATVAPPVAPTVAGAAAESAKASGTAKSAIEATVGDNTVTLNVDDEVKKYALIAIGLLAANVLIGLVLIVFGVMTCVRRGSSRRNSRVTTTTVPQYVPVKLHEEGGYSEHYQQPYGQ